MKYKELFAAKGIFADVFNSEYPTEYAAIFGDIQPEKLDVYALLNYGEQTLFPTITADNYKSIVSAVISVNLQPWQRESAAMLAEYDVAAPLTSETETTETVTEMESSDGTELGADKAFNNTDFTDGERTTTTDAKNRQQERKTTEKSKGNGQSKSISTEIAKELELRRDNWRKNVIFALVNEITLSIYE